jgi:transposase
LKSPEQQDIQMLHRVRQNLVKQRTAVANQTRGVLGEYGIVIRQGLGQRRQRLPEILEDAENGLSAAARAVFAEVTTAWLTSIGRSRVTWTKSKRCIARARRVRSSGRFRGSARSPRQRRSPPWAPASGGVAGYRAAAGVQWRQTAAHGHQPALRYLPAHLADPRRPRAVVKVAARQDDAMRRWINDRVQRRNPNIAAVAVANKNARTIWALLTRDEDYRAPVSQAA